MRIKRLSWIDFVAIAAVLYVLVTRAPMWLEHWRMEGGIASAAELRDLEGRMVEFPGEGQRQSSILVFWATWCGPCELELSRLRDASQEGKLDPARIITVSVGEEAEAVRKVVEERKYPFRNLLDPAGKFAQSFHVEATPTIVFLDAESKVAWVTSGLSPTLVMRASRHLAAGK